MEELKGYYPGLFKLRLKVSPTLENVYHFLVNTTQKEIKDIEFEHNIFVINRDEKMEISEDLSWVLVYRHAGKYSPVVLKKDGGYGTIFEDINFTNRYECLIRNKVVANENQARVAKLFLNGLRSLCLKWDTGKGKTLASIFSAECMMRKEIVSGVVLVAPKSLLTNFRDTIIRYGGDIEKYTIIGYDAFRNRFKLDEDPLMSKPLEQFMKGKLLIVDEAHNLRTKVSYNIAGMIKSGRKAFVMIKAAKYAKRVLLLTATPIVNVKRDVCNLVDMMKQTGNANKSKDISYEEFTHLVAGRFSVNEQDPDDPNFPKKFIDFINVDMTDEQRLKYRQIIMSMDKRIDYSPSTFYTGYRIGSNFIDISYKADIIADSIASKPEGRRKSLIFSVYKDSGIELIKDILKSKGMKTKIISGDVDSAERDRNKRLYDKGRIDALLLTSAGGEGLDFKDTKNIYIMESGWNFATLRQKIGRGVRYKSHAPGDYVNIYILKAQSDETSSAFYSGDRILEEISYTKEVHVQEAEDIIRKSCVESSLGKRVMKKTEDIFDKETYYRYGGKEY
jgi:superfamily II DNA or RNA helicase